MADYLGHDLVVFALISWLVYKSFLSGTLAKYSLNKGWSAICLCFGLFLGGRLLNFHIKAGEHVEGALPLTYCQASFSFLRALRELS